MRGAARRLSHRIVWCAGALFVVMAGAAFRLAPSAARDQPPRRDPAAVSEAWRRLSGAEAAHGADSLQAALAIDALLEAGPGDGTDLEPLALRAIRIKERLPGVGHREAAATMGATASWLLRAGRPQHALPMAERALEVHLATAGPTHVETIRMMLILADACRQTGRVARALRQYERAMRLITRELGPAHPMLAPPLHYAGTLRADIGDLREARSLLERSLAIRTRTHGRGDNLAATTLNALGNVLLREGDLDAAFAAFVEAEASWRGNAEVPDHFAARAITNQGLVRMRQGRLDEAGRLLREALAIRQRSLGPRHFTVARGRIHLANLAAAMGETVRAEAEIRDALRDQAFELGESHPELMNGLASLARVQLLQDRRPDAIATALRCERIWQDLARRAAPDVPDPEDDPLDTALAALAAGDQPAGTVAAVWEERVRSHGLREGRPIADGGLLDPWRRALTPGTALLSYARYTRPVRGAASGEDAWLALVLRPGSGPEAIPLGEAAAVQAAVLAWREEVSRDPRSLPRPEAESRYRRRARALADLIWTPLQGALGDASRLWVVPEGPLREVNLATLVMPDGAYVLESGPAVHTMQSELTLLSPPRRGEGRGILAVGGPEFGLGECGPARAFGPLPGARDEVEALRGTWAADPVVTLTGAEALESAFRLLAPGRRVLHIATHAFAAGNPLSRRPLDPELSGLALAGANGGCWDHPEEDDGLLTGREIAGLDLSDVEWAVLSGCETGVDRTGLGRAFRQAGVRRVVTTLWPVEDGAARAWMGHFYGQGLAGKTAGEAVQSASRAILQEQSRRGDTTHPFFWGGFVSSGDDR